MTGSGRQELALGVDPPGGAGGRSWLPVGIGRIALRFRFLRGLLLFFAAFAGGVVATLAYHIAVEPPVERQLQGPRPSSVAITPPWKSEQPEILVDPIKQTIEGLRASLPAAALVQLSTRYEHGVVHVSGKADSRATVALVARAVGQVAGVDAVDVRAVTIAERSHFIVAGDNMYNIARRYYGESCGWKKIIEANPRIDFSVLRVGQTLTIPPRDR